MKKSVETHQDGKATTTYHFHEKQPFWKSVYDSSTGKVLGRNAFQWFQLLVFYICFFTSVAALFAISMKGLFHTIDEHVPSYQLAESCIGTNPGMGFRPASRRSEDSLIWYDMKNKTQARYYVEALDTFLEGYIDAKKTASRGVNQIVCDYDARLEPPQVCFQEVTNWSPCTSAEGYGYEKASPCIFLKLNRIYGWTPEYYEDLEDLPEDMPQDLVDYITALPVQQRRQVWMSCRGENPHDTETIGPIEYVGPRGFPDYFYPFVNQPGYLSPLIPVRLARPTVNQIINVECRAWAKNIVYEGGSRGRKGSVHFEIMIDAHVKRHRQ